MIRNLKALVGVLVMLMTPVLAGATAWAQQLDGIESGFTDNGGPLGARSGDPGHLLQQLGIPAEQLQQLRDQASGNGSGSPDMQRLCASVAAKHLSPDETESISHAMGLSDDDLNHLVSCARLSNARSDQLGSGKGLTRGFVPGTAISESSSIEQRFHELDTPYKLLAAPSLSRLSQFGYDLFSSRMPASPTFDNVPVSADYIVGPGDELNVLLWGRINRAFKLSVQRDGTVLVPQVGPLPVAGLSFAQAQKTIESQIDQIEGVQSDVTMGRIKTIQVFTIGQVAEPGLQNVSALAHVSDALVAAGGVSKTGSLRRVELRRDNHVIRIVDLYSLLLHGDISADERLQPRDVVFVPVVGPVVGVAGDVKNSAIYELKGNETIESVLRMAGGVSAFGYAQRVQVERVQNHQQRIALDVDLDNPQPRKFIAGDGDLIKVFTVLPDQENVVKLQGNVNRPGSYQWEEGMRVVDLIRDGQGVRDRTFFDYALLKRHQGAARTTHFLRVDLGEAITNQSSLADSPLEPGDALTVYSEGEINEVPTVTVRGEVRKPGTYPLTDGMKVSDLVYEAGGPKEDAYLAKAQLARIGIVDGSVTQHSYEDIDLSKALEGSADNLTLHGGEELFVTQASNWHLPWTVQVKGEAMRPGPYVIREGQPLASVLEECGGMRPDGYLRGLILLRRSLKEVQRKNIELARTRLEGEITRVALTPTTNRQQAEPNITEKAAALRMLENMLTQSASQQAIGRIVLNIDSLESLNSSTSNVRLEDGDEIIIPKQPSWVNVMGEVYGPAGVAYDPALTVRQYIDRAGGFTREADEDQVFVVKVTGEIVSIAGFKESGKNHIFPLLPLISGGLMQARLEPGDTIYVPTKFMFVNPLQRNLDITQIVANSAQAIAYAALLGTLL
jgi:protein involved in polysaccharide export with SLBB domain